MRQVVQDYRVPVRWRDPWSLWSARFLGWLHGKAIAGQNGAVRYDGPGSIQAQRTYYTGYVFPPQIFTGWNPRHVAGGRARVATPAFPATTSPMASAQTPTSRAMEAVTAAQRLNLPSAWDGRDVPGA